MMKKEIEHTKTAGKQVYTCMKKLPLLITLTLLCTLALSAQQSSKTKSKDRFREKSENATPASVNTDLGTIQKPEMARIVIESVREKDQQPIQGASIFIFQATRDSLIHRAASLEPDRRPVQTPNNWDNMSYDKPDLYSNAVGEAMADFEAHKYYWVLVRDEKYGSQKKFVHVDTAGPIRLRFEMQE